MYGRQLCGGRLIEEVDIREFLEGFARLPVVADAGHAAVSPSPVRYIRAGPVWHRICSYPGLFYSVEVIQRRNRLTKEEARYLAQVQDLGCIVCRGQGNYTVAEIHHIVEGGRRKGHEFVLPLCVPHHRGGCCTDLYVSRHPFKAQFEARYGTEWELFNKVQELLNARHRD